VPSIPSSPFVSLPDYNLLVDIGNTFLKWGLFRNGCAATRPQPAGVRHVLLAEY
jgi:hypothetical protein